MSNNQQLPGTVGFRNQGISAERCAVHASEDVLGVNSLPFFRNKDLYELFECYVHIHLLILPEDPESGIWFNAEVLILLRNDGFIV